MCWYKPADVRAVELFIETIFFNKRNKFVTVARPVGAGPLFIPKSKTVIELFRFGPNGVLKNEFLIFRTVGQWNRDYRTAKQDEHSVERHGAPDFYDFFITNTFENRLLVYKKVVKKKKIYIDLFKQRIIIGEIPRCAGHFFFFRTFVIAVYATAGEQYSAMSVGFFFFFFYTYTRPFRSTQSALRQNVIKKLLLFTVRTAMCRWYYERSVTLPFCLIYTDNSPVRDSYTAFTVLLPCELRTGRKKNRKSPSADGKQTLSRDSTFGVFENCSFRGVDSEHCYGY